MTVIAHKKLLALVRILSFMMFHLGQFIVLFLTCNQAKILSNKPLPTQIWSSAKHFNLPNDVKHKKHLHILVTFENKP